MRSKKLFKKKHIRHYRAKKSLLKNRLRSRNHNSLKKKRSKMLYRNIKRSKKLRRRQVSQLILLKRKSKMPKRKNINRQRSN